MGVVTDPVPRHSRSAVRLARQAGFVALFVAAALLGTVSGVVFAYSDDLPRISALDDYEPNTITRLLAADGRVIGDFAVERRLVIDYDQISPVLRRAIIATEDAGFEGHFGLSITRIMVTAVNDVLRGELAGASTITQQLARNLFPIGFQKTPARKLQEAILAIQIEKRYTKREIFTFYANQIYFGHGAYGVEAAARLYFDKSANDLNLEEAAMVAAILQAPERLSPYVDLDRTRARRNYVLQRMADEGFISSADAESASQRPVEVQRRDTETREVAPYFVEDIRRELDRQYGANALYEGGLVVQTTLDVDLQQAATRALDRGLRQVDKRRSSYRGAARNILDEGDTLDQFEDDRWAGPVFVGDIVPALVTSVPERGPGRTVRVRIGPSDLDLPPASYAWTQRASPADLFRVGDLVDVEVRSRRDGIPTALALEQTPVVEGALIAIDNRTGQVRAMVGGVSFGRSEFNRATQAQRQMGSAFKPIVYTAAIDRGFTAASLFVDEPVSFDVGPDQRPYEPLNYDRTFAGPVTLRRALEQSRNIPAVKAMDEIGPAQIVDYARRFGFPNTWQPYLSLALGAAEASLIEVVSAYSAFPNHGVRMTPYSIVSVADREGNLLEEHRAASREAVRADTAYIMTHLLEGVVQRGTASAAAALDWPLGGKTGTVDDYTDAWFVGFDPDLTVGVWVGHDEKRSIGDGETGSAAALPIWMEVIRAHIATHDTADEPPAFVPPGNIVFVTLEPGTTEAFISGTQPQPGEGRPTLAAPSPVAAILPTALER